VTRALPLRRSLRGEGSRRLIAACFAVAAVVLVPWIVALGFVLPATHRSSHWNLAWVGFDVMLGVALASVALSAWRRSPWFEGAAIAAATLLVVDAWFDVLTSSTTAELGTALVEAVFVELPIAVACFVLARSAKRRLQWARSQPGGRAPS
jgi:hypothetical protein